MEKEKVEVKSEYLEVCKNFMEYAAKDYINGTDGQRCLMVIAGDEMLPGNKRGVFCAGTGGRALLAEMLAEAMDNEKFEDLFKAARMVSKSVDLYDYDTKQVRHEIRIGHIMTALVVFWCLCLLSFQLFGVSNLITTVSNMLMMAWVSFLHYRRMKDLYRRLHRIEEQRKEFLEEKLKHAFKGLVKSMMALKKSDEDND